MRLKKSKSKTENGISNQSSNSTNKKIKGAKKHLYNNIKFNSSLELYCYKLLEAANIKFGYEVKTFKIWRGFRLEKVNFIHQIGKVNKLFGMDKTKRGEKLILQDIHYTPDFIVMDSRNIIIIETKGIANDVYPYKRKLFFEFLENLNTHKDIWFFEPKNQKQVDETLIKIKLLLNENNR